MKHFQRTKSQWTDANRYIETSLITFFNHFFGSEITFNAAPLAQPGMNTFRKPPAYAGRKGEHSSCGLLQRVRTATPARDVLFASSRERTRRGEKIWGWLAISGRLTFQYARAVHFNTKTARIIAAEAILVALEKRRKKSCGIGKRVKLTWTSLPAETADEHLPATRKTQQY